MQSYAVLHLVTKRHYGLFRRGDHISLLCKQTEADTRMIYLAGVVEDTAATLLIDTNGWRVLQNALGITWQLVLDPRDGITVLLQAVASLQDQPEWSVFPVRSAQKYVLDK